MYFVLLPFERNTASFDKKFPLIVFLVESVSQDFPMRLERLDYNDKKRLNFPKYKVF